MNKSPNLFLAYAVGITAKASWLAGIAAVIVGWQIISLLEVFPAVFLPSPLAVLDVLLKTALSGVLLSHAVASTSRVFAGFLASALISLPLGIWIAVSPPVMRLFAPLLNISKYLPVLAFIPLTIIWFGIGDSSKVFLLALGTVPYLASLTVLSIEHIPKHMIETAQLMGLTKGQMVWRVIIPYAAPQIMEASRISIALCWTYITVAELFAAQSGLGYLIVQSQRYLKTDLIFAAILVIGLLGLITDRLFFAAQKKWFGWAGDEP